MRHALAAVTTHDLPTLHGWWSGHDIDLWEKLGFYADASVGERVRAERQSERERLLRALRREKLWPGDSARPRCPNTRPSSAARCTCISARARRRWSPCSSKT